MKYLADTNIFLEVLLGQKNKEACKSFLLANNGLVCISDFSLHSIGVILFRHKEFSLFEKFAEDILENLNVLSLSQSNYRKLAKHSTDYVLDFDDAYQLSVSKEFDLIIKTQDKDFERVTQEFKIEFL